MQTIRIADKQVVLADGKWRSSDPALQELFNDHLAYIQSDIPEHYGREDRERFAAEAAARDLNAEIVDGLLTPVHQKDRERLQLERFRVNSSEFPLVNIIEGERPDVLIERSPGRAVGIELTELYRSTPAKQVPRQAIESLKKQAVQHAQSIYERARGPALYVYVRFGRRGDWRKSRVLSIAQQLAKIVSDHPLDMDHHIELNAWHFERGYFPEQIDTVAILRPSNITDALWASPDGDAIPQLLPSDVQNRIDEKPSVKDYRQRATEEIWLVITYGFSVSSWFQRSDEALNHVYKSTFDRLFLFDTFREVIDELDKINADSKAEPT